MLQQIKDFAGVALDSVVSVVGVRAGEQPRFEVLAQLGAIEVRRYAARLVAETLVPGEEKAARGEGFSRLAGYIFGANRGAARIAMTAPVAQDGRRIAMTAPVAQSGGAGEWRIRFFLPHDLKAPPEPNDARVTIATVPAETVAVLRFAGSTGPDAVAAARGRLLAALEGSDWAIAGESVAWFYDPPWTLPPLRRNEVAVPVRPRVAAGK